MTILLYSIIEIVSLYMIYIGEKKNKHLKKLSYFTVWLILTALITLRDVSVGQDYQNYYYAIIRVAEGKMRSYDSNWLSPGFRAIIRLFSHMGIPATAIVMIITFIFAAGTIYFFLRAIREFSIEPVLSLFILYSFCYVFQAMNQFRQMFAVALVLYSFRYIDKSLWRYVLIIVIASLLHSSALIMLPMYWIVKLDINKKLVFIYFIMAIAVIFLWPIARKLIEYTPYAYYLGWKQYDVAATNTSILNLIVRIIMVMFTLVFYKKVIAFNPRNNILYHMVIICTVLQVLSIYINLFTRITTYFYVFYILLIPEVMLFVKKCFTYNSKKYISIAIWCVFLAYQIVYFHAQSQESCYAIYKTIF